MRCWIATLSAVLLTIATGCDSGIDSGGQPSTTAPSELASPNPGTRDDADAGRVPGGPRIVKATWDWKVVLSDIPLRYKGWTLTDGDYLLRRGENRYQTAVTDRESGEVLTRIESGEGRAVQRIFLDAPWVVWTVAEDAPPYPITAYVHDLRDGTTTVVNQAPGAHEPGFPQTWSVADGRAAYTTQDRPDTNCITILDLETMTGRILDCTPEKRMGTGDARISTFGIGYNQWTLDPRPMGCRTVRFARLGTLEDITEAAAQKACEPLMGMVAKDFVFWTERDLKNREPGSASLYARPQSGKIVRLGRINTATAIPCRGWVYWTKSLRRTQVRRWRPGSPVEIVYESSPGFVATNRPHCQGDRITLYRDWLDAPAYGQLIEAQIPE